MRLGLLLTLVVSPLAGQSVRSRLEARVPTAAVPTVDSLVQVAAREGLPTEPLVQKALEGGAKHVPAARIGAAAQEMLEQLRDARALLVRAGDAPPATAAEVTTIYAALKRGVPAPVVERVVAAMPQEPRGSALHAVADLAAHRFDPDSSAGLIIDAARQGLRGERLLDVSTAVLHELQRGHSHAEAVAVASPRGGAAAAAVTLRYTLKLLSFATAPCRGRDAPVRPRVSTVKRAKVARAIPLEEHAHDSSHAHHAGVARRPGDRRGAAALADAGPDAGG